MGVCEWRHAARAKKGRGAVSGFEPCHYLPASDPPFASGAGWDQGPESEASEQQAERRKKEDGEGRGASRRTKKKKERRD